MLVCSFRAFPGCWGAAGFSSSPTGSSCSLSLVTFFCVVKAWELRDTLIVHKTRMSMRHFWETFISQPAAAAVHLGAGTQLCLVGTAAKPVPERGFSTSKATGPLIPVTPHFVPATGQVGMCPPLTPRGDSLPLEERVGFNSLLHFARALLPAHSAPKLMWVSEISLIFHFSWEIAGQFLGARHVPCSRTHGLRCGTGGGAA